MSSDFIPVTCTSASVLFDAVDTEADDHDETWLLYDLFAKTVGA